MRKRPGVVLGIVAIVLSLAGTATAAHFVITSGSQVKPGVIQLRHLSRAARAALRGQKGPAGAAGATGPQGPKGDTGPRGAQGSPGPLVDTLPSGRTLRGVFALQTKTTAGETAITYPFPLASAPTAHYVTSGPTADCPGSASAPAATAGNLCVYPGNHSGPDAQIFNPEVGGTGGSLDRYGFGLSLQQASDGTSIYASGTWAVTAP